MYEKVKRLEPTTETKRRLYLTSGNQCAFEGCKKMIISSDGELLGEICHIEAAMPGGDRFNPNQTNEERRDFDNLMMLCLDHHKITNNVDKYPVEKLQEMKKNHEKKFADAVSKLESSIEDLTEKQTINFCQSLEAANNILQWGNNEEELREMVIIVNNEADKLKKLVPDTRSVFSIMIERSENAVFSVEEVRRVAGLTQNEFYHHYKMLNKYYFIDEVEVLDGDYISSLETVDGWPLWTDIK
ncbi:hypothetical protein ACFWGV_21195, partial [Bacillus subtilis]